MFERDNRIYYEGRAAQATELGDCAADSKIAALHYELALRYAVLAVQGNQARPEVVALGRDRSGAIPERAKVMPTDSAAPEFEPVLKQA